MRRQRDRAVRAGPRPTPVSKRSSTAGDPDGLLLLAEVDHHGQRAATHGEHPRRPRRRCTSANDGAVRSAMLAPQRGQLPVDRQHPSAARRGRLRPVELRAAVRRLVLRVGNDVGVPAVPGELVEPALGRRPADLRVGVAGEELERGRGRPLLALEQHRGERRAQRHQSGARQLVVVERVGEAVPGGPVADLVVVLAADDEPPRRHDLRVDRGAVLALAERRPRPVVEEARARTPSPARRAARSRRSSRGSRRSARRAARGGSRRSTARPARSRRAAG